MSKNKIKKEKSKRQIRSKNIEGQFPNIKIHSVVNIKGRDHNVTIQAEVQLEGDNFIAKSDA